MAAVPPAVPTLSRTLRSRHVALISIGGIIGAGLFIFLREQRLRGNAR